MKKQAEHRMNRIFLVALVFFLFQIIYTAPCRAQIDYYYGKNTHGFRISAGFGEAVLITHYHTNPFEPVLLANVEYDVNPYFTIGIEGQRGTLKGVDDLGHLYYQSSTNSYKSVNLNFKVAVGTVFNFFSPNKLTDALKRFYIGTGAGIISNNITFTYDVNREAYAYGEPKPTGTYLTIPFNIGTNIDLPNVLGHDRFEICPKFQFSYVPTMYTDGFISSAQSHLKGFYNVTSLSVKYKF